MGHLNGPIIGARDNRRNKGDMDNESNDIRIEAGSFSMDIAGASTPIGKSRVGEGEWKDGETSSLFISPIRRFDELHIGSDKDLEHLANQTLIEDSDSEPESYNEHRISGNKAVGSNLERKRQWESSLDVDMMTPVASIVCDARTRTLSLLTTLTSFDKLKLSFSTSESTPCPVQPRKKLKVKGSPSSATPCQKRTSNQKCILNLRNSTKTTSKSLLFQHMDTYEKRPKMNEDLIFSNDEEAYIPFDSYTSSPHQFSTFNTSIQSESDALKIPNSRPCSTPLSQSTPTNSKPPSPGENKRPTPNLEEYGPTISGYRFVRPKVSSSTHDKFQTPINNCSRSAELRSSYNRNDYDRAYEIIGEYSMKHEDFDNTDEDFIANRRINDPYLNKKDSHILEAQFSLNSECVRSEYFKSFHDSSFRLPLLQLFEPKQLSLNEILGLINDGKSILEFFKFINVEDESLYDLLRQERHRWHPDKWIHRLKTNSSTVDFVNKRVIDNVSQVLNSLVQSYA